MGTCQSAPPPHVPTNPLHRRRVELNTVSTLEQQPSLHPERFNLICAQWLTTWLVYTCGNSSNSPIPGPITNHNLVKYVSDPSHQVNAAFPLPNIIPDKHFRRINPSVWAFFLSSYGGGPSIVVDRKEGFDYTDYDDTSSWSIDQRFFATDNNCNDDNPTPSSAYELLGFDQGTITQLRTRTSWLAPTQTPSLSPTPTPSLPPTPTPSLPPPPQPEVLTHPHRKASLKQTANTVVVANHMDSLLADDEFFSQDRPITSPLDRTDSFFRRRRATSIESYQSEDDEDDTNDAGSECGTSVGSRDSVAWLFQD